MGVPTVAAVTLNKPTIGDKVQNKEEKVVDNSSQIDHTNSIEVAKSFMKKESFVAQVYAYVPFYNESRKKYDMFKVSIDPTKDATILERIELRHDNHGRAIAEMQQMYAKDYLDNKRGR